MAQYDFLTFVASSAISCNIVRFSNHRHERNARILGVGEVCGHGWQFKPSWFVMKVLFVRLGYPDINIMVFRALWGGLAWHVREHLLSV